MIYEMTGTVKLVKDTQTFPSGFYKREFVITDEDDRFPQDIAFECLKENTNMLDELQAGERVKVSFNIRGREYQERHFVNLVCFKFERLDATAAGAEDIEVIPEDEPPLDDSMPF